MVGTTAGSWPRRLPFLGVVLVSFAVPWLACFGRVLFQDHQFAFRDAGNYYYPLHQRVQQEWDAGRWPLWEPEENGGMPLLGNPTAAVLYPGKVVFALVDYPLAARLYVLGHVLLASLSMGALLRHWEVRGAGSALGALAYAFGGPILFQYANVIYLVGAAWLPLGIRAADRWARLGRRGGLAELAVVLAMQTLGGDPETAYLTGVCAAGYTIVLWWRGPGTTGAQGSGRRRERGRLIIRGAILLAVWTSVVLGAAVGLPALRPAAPAGQPRAPFPWAGWVEPAVATVWGLVGLALVWRWWRLRRAGVRSRLVPRLAGLLVAAGVAAAVSAAQLLPTLEFIGLSGRNAADGPHDIYPFSLDPTRVVELIWPHVFGTHSGGNRSWLAALPSSFADVNPWVPSLYLGGLTLVLALVGMGSNATGRPTPGRGWLLAIAIVSLAASFGEHGSPLWLSRLIPGAAKWVGPHDGTATAAGDLPGALRDGDGGVYWLLATALPGFGQFRYPSKLFTFTVLGLAGLAGFGWDALASDDPRARRRMVVWSGALLLLTLIAMAASLALSEPWRDWLAAQDLVTEFGPLDVSGAMAQTREGLAQAAVILAVALGVGAWRVNRRPRLAAALVLAVTSADLAWANAHLVLTVPQSILDAPAQVASLIERAERAQPTPGPYRVHRMANWGPNAWGETGPSDRFQAITDWTRQTIGPKHGITLGLSYTLSLGVTELYDYRWFFGAFPFSARETAAGMLGVAPGTRVIAHPRRAFDLWTTRYFVLPYYARWDDSNRGYGSFLEHSERIYPPIDAFTGPGGRDREYAWARDQDYQVRRNLAAYPRAWLVHEARTMPPIQGLSRAGRSQPMEEMLFSNDRIWSDPTRVVHDPRRTVWLEANDADVLAPYLAGGPPSATESVNVVRYDPDRVELETVLERPGIVILADVYYPGWELTIDGQSATIHRANRLMRGAAVPSGRHRLVYSYRPSSFTTGLRVSGLGLVALGLLRLWSILPECRSKQSRGDSAL